MNALTNENGYCPLEEMDSVNSLVQYFHIEMVDSFPLWLMIRILSYLAGRHEFLNAGVK